MSQEILGHTRKTLGLTPDREIRVEPSSNQKGCIPFRVMTLTNKSHQPCTFVDNPL
ncbi:uncharacterized protein G2W53_014234 [Senna tora]|uniref:Uncharacterized protein n=1 Tax=Senna tora TaxID=362788 RepID=A0A835C624_9FABA|nr:uncharacterized protein G2W53_014234 [Senna tora]